MKRIKIFLAMALMLAVAGMQAADVTGQAEEALKALKAQIAPDGRQAIFDVNTIMQGDVLTVTGTVGVKEQKEAISEALKAKGIGPVANNVVVLSEAVPEGQRWAQVKLSVATLRTSGRHAAEVATQGIMGMPLRVIEQAEEWWRVQCPDGYIAWIPTSSVVTKTEAELQAWRSAERYIVTAYDSRLVTEPKGDETVGDLIMGNILTFKAKKGKWLQLATPDGREGWVPASDVAEFSKWAQQDFDAKQIEKTARRMLGSGYMWGANTTKITDCSGLAKLSYFSNGIILRRDASQQALTGQKIAGSDWQQCQPMDLLFFGNSETGRVTHVGLYLGEGKYIHCSGMVKINSLDPADPTYLYSPLSCSRVSTALGTEGIEQVKNSKWYF